MKKYKLTDIEWDTDEEVRTDLPQTVTVLVDPLQAQGGYEVEDVLSDWLSDNYGWLHLGFKFEEVK